MSKVNLSLRREIQINILQGLLRITKREVVDIKSLDLLAIIVERNILRSVQSVPFGNDHQVKDFPTITARGREAMKASFDVPNLDAKKKTRFCVLQVKKGSTMKVPVSDSPPCDNVY